MPQHTTPTHTPTTPPALNVSLTPLKPAIRAAGEGELEVLLRVQAPAVPGQQVQRTPLSLALVIDRSGSMSGANIAAAKACALDLVQRLHSQDEVCLVAYDTEVDVVLPLMAAGQAGQHIRPALNSFDARGGTDLHGGWLKGAQQLAGRTGADRLCRVILLSDGQANEGETRIHRICEQVAQLAQAGISTTTVGLGEGFNEALMTAMAEAGQGNALYGDRAEDLAEPFDAEIGLLSHLAWRDVRLVPGSATGKWQLLNDYSKTADGAWALPSIAQGSEAWALFTVPMDSAANAQRRSRQGMALHVTITARDAEGRAIEVKASLPALPEVDEATWASLPADALVARRVAEVRSAYLQKKARTAVERGDWAEAERLLKQVEELAAEQPWVLSMVAHLRELMQRRDRARFGKEAMYSAHRMSTRISETDEAVMFDATMELVKPAYLRRKAVQGRGA